MFCTLYLNLLGVIAVAENRPDADQPHQRDADGGNAGQQRADIAHHRQRNHADDPVHTQAVIQLDFLRRRHLPVGETAVDFTGAAFLKERERVVQQPGKTADALHHDKTFDKPLGHAAHNKRQQRRDHEGQQVIEIREFGFAAGRENVVDCRADHHRHDEQGQ